MAWIDEYTDSVYINKMCDKHFEGSSGKMAVALHLNPQSMSTWLRPDGKVPPHVNKLAELWDLSQRNLKSQNLEMFLIVIDKEHENQLRFAVELCKGEIQKLKGV